MIRGIVWPDVAAAAVAYLEDALAARVESVVDGVAVSGRRTSATRQVVVRDDGGRAVADVRASVRLGFTVVAGSDADAADLSKLVAGLVADWPAVSDVVVGVESVTLPAPVDDGSEIPTRYLSAALIVRGVSV